MDCLKTQHNERRCGLTEQVHEIDLPPCCPRSGNPLPGSVVQIHYMPGRFHIEVASLLKYIHSFEGGKGEVRSMEGMIQTIAQDCADAIRVNVTVVAELNIAPTQRMKLTCHAQPK